MTSASVVSPWTPLASPATDLRAATLDRRPDATWRRTSYSALTAAAHDTGRVGSEPESPGVQDEPDGVTDEPPTADSDDGRGRRHRLPDGRPAVRHARSARSSTRCWSTSTPSAPDLAAEVAAPLRSRARPTPATTRVRPCSRRCHTPLGPLAGDLTLADDRPAGPPRGARLRAAARRRRRPAPTERRGPSATSPACCARHLPADDPFAPYADRLGLALDRAPARLPHRLDRRRPARARRRAGRPPVPRRRLQDEPPRLVRRARSTAVALPAGVDASRR